MPEQSDQPNPANLTLGHVGYSPAYKRAAKEVVDGLFGAAPLSAPPSKTFPDTRPRWRHKKRGTVYVELARGCMQTARDEFLDDQSVVIYQAEDGAGCIWVRPAYEFEDGRFERLP